MKRFFAISFLLIYLFSTTELHQLLKVPLLVQHFIEHREENKQVTLWQFLYVHYAMKDAKDADHEKDMKLPFKSHDNCIAAISNVYLPLSEKISIQQPLEYSEKKNFSREDDHLLTSFLSNIWQPPRAC